MSLSFQLYSAREFTPWEDVLATLAEIGYTQVEGFGANYEQPQHFKECLQKNGLSMPSGHIALDSLENDSQQVFDTANRLGMQKIVCPFLAPDLRPNDSAGWQAIAQRLQAVSTKVRDAGFTFAWHNHEFEFIACESDGSVPMDIMLEQAPDMEWEADIAWIVRAHADPMQWIERYGERITVAHVKDIAPAGECEDEDGWADVGFGVLDWLGIYRALRAAGTDLFIAEHDKPNDFKRFASRSFQSYQSLNA